MALALIYIFAIAKPFSLRRLTVLFVSTLILATTMQTFFRTRRTESEALFVALSLTLFVWAIPMFQVLRDTVYSRVLTLDALHRVSEPVKWTYGVAIVGASVTVLSATFNGTREFNMGSLFRVLAAAAVISLLLRPILCALDKRFTIQHRSKVTGPPKRGGGRRRCQVLLSPAACPLSANARKILWCALLRLSSVFIRASGSRDSAPLLPRFGVKKPNGSL